MEEFVCHHEWVEKRTNAVYKAANIPGLGLQLQKQDDGQSQEYVCQVCLGHFTKEQLRVSVKESYQLSYAPEVP